MGLVFSERKVDSNLYFKFEGERLVMILLYADGLFLTREEELITEVRRILATEFEIKDLGMMHYVLGIEVWTREVCSREPQEVQDDGMHDQTQWN